MIRRERLLLQVDKVGEKIHKKWVGHLELCKKRVCGLARELAIKRTL